MKIITYLFGAGASKHALPIVNEIPGRIKNLIAFLEDENSLVESNSYFEDLKIPNPKSKREYQIEMIDSLKWMMEKSSKHASVDTFAKKLFIKNEFKDLEKLKIALSVFFIFEQALNKPDYRYDAFFAALLFKKDDFPENVRILSWNYDYQFELVYSEYSGKKSIADNQYWLGVNSKYELRERAEGFTINKLNGTTGLYTYGDDMRHLFTDTFEESVDEKFIEKIVKGFVQATYYKRIRPSLSFAWEEEYPSKPEYSLLSHVVEIVKDSVALVVVGYSFPFFNREIDRRIIGSMVKLKRVYFQAPDADTIKERFQAVRDDLSGIELVSKFDVDQFLLPNEL